MMEEFQSCFYVEGNTVLISVLSLGAYSTHLSISTIMPYIGAALKVYHMLIFLSIKLTFSISLLIFHCWDTKGSAFFKIAVGLLLS